jgi:FAD/FMN-containing dehydrogenase
VVLANGEILQTGRISKKELQKKKGLQSFEGEIYRNLDNLIEDSKQVIADNFAENERDNIGYPGIARVKQKDGSFDLTPLFVGSQGTLGIISELIMRGEYMSQSRTVAVISFTSKEFVRDVAEYIEQKLDPASIDYFDSKVFDTAAAEGRRYEATNSVLDTDGAVLLILFDDFSDRHRRRKLKKLNKELVNYDAQIVTAEGQEADELLTLREVTTFTVNPSAPGESAPPLIDGVYIPKERFGEFSLGIVELANRLHIKGLALHGRMLDNIYYARPILELQTVPGKQKVFKLLDEYSKLVTSCNGNIVAEAGEGRLKTYFAYKSLNEDVIELNLSIKSIFDPYGILNTGVKQVPELKNLTSSLRGDYDLSTFADRVSPYN